MAWHENTSPLSCETLSLAFWKAGVFALVLILFFWSSSQPSHSDYWFMVKKFLMLACTSELSMHSKLYMIHIRWLFTFTNLIHETSLF